MRSEASGFARAGIGHLPKNARGVMFYPASRAPRPADFHVTSAEDKRPLSLRVHAFKGAGWVRLEPVHGFQPGARYRFRYLPRHGAWTYPDEMTVAIDDEVVTSEGDYAIELASAPAYKVVLVPTSSGSCVEPSPAVVQAFTYRIPPSLQRYRDALDYSANIAAVSRAGAPAKPRPFVPSWTETPTLYERENGSLGLGFSKQYTTRDNAVVAACGTRWPRLRLTGAVSFPELDTLDHRTPATEFDINRNIEGRCDPLESLVRTVDWRSPEPSLRELCHANIAGSFAMGGLPLRDVDRAEWARELSFFTSMSATCNLVGLTYLWHTGQYSTQPDVVREIGAALATGLRSAEPADRDAAVHALAYLTDHLPREKRSAMSRQLLAPVQAALVQMSSAPHPARPEELAKLIALAR
jgi:hypothetical protein